MEKLKIGLVGIGRGTAYGEIFKNNPRTEVAALCDINAEGLEENAKEFNLDDKHLFTSYDNFIESDFDVAVIGTPIPFHQEQVIKALDSGKHVLSEVTACNNIEGCYKIADAVKRNNKQKYMMAENCDYMYFTRQWKKTIEQGKIGRIIYAEAEYMHNLRDMILDSKTNKTKWRAQRAPIHYCSHSLGPILYWADDYIIKTTCMGKNVSMIPDVGVGAIDFQVALFETKKGIIIKVLRSSVVARKPMFGHYIVYGTKGYMENGWKEYDNMGKSYFEDEDEEAKPMKCSSTDPDAPEAAKLGGHGSSEYYLANDFIDSIINDTKPPIDIVKAMDLTVPGLVAHESAMKGNTWMDVPRIGL